jgi:hypothetical protein
MKQAALASIFSLFTALYSTAAFADNIAKCEVVLLETIEDESGRGGAQVASYRPAGDFMASVYQEDSETLYTIDDLAIQAVMCERFDVVPSESDFKVVATGIPFFLSQSFESQDSDLVSLFFKEGAFRYNYKGPGLSDETKALLNERLKSFNAMEHDLDEKEAALMAEKSEDNASEELKQSTKDADTALEEASESE